jgi:hypothetical protein
MFGEEYISLLPSLAIPDADFVFIDIRPQEFREFLSPESCIDQSIENHLIPPTKHPISPSSIYRVIYLSEAISIHGKRKCLLDLWRFQTLARIVHIDESF